MMEEVELPEYGIAKAQEEIVWDSGKPGKQRHTIFVIDGILSGTSRSNLAETEIVFFNPPIEDPVHRAVVEKLLGLEEIAGQEPIEHDGELYQAFIRTQAYDPSR